MRVLIAEDDRELATRVREALEQAGFAADPVADGVDAEFMGREESYDLVVLDLGLPGKSGLDVLRSWREHSHQLPVLILTARDAWYEKVEGFQAGADDYLAKPFHMAELMARVQALVRRAHNQASPVLTRGPVVLDENTQAVRVDGDAVTLTGTEYRLLHYMMLHPDTVLSKTRLTEHVYEYDEDKDSNVIEVYIKRLREKIGKERIQTRRGQGYVFHAASQDTA